MSEDANFNGEWWNNRLNNFLSKLLKWEQLGTGNINVNCGNHEKPIGLDSVFAYRTSYHARQQIVLAEAKFRKSFKDLNKASLQEWVDVLLFKTEAIQSCRDFKAKFAPDSDAKYNTALLGIWVNDISSYNHSILNDRLATLEMPDKHNPLYLFVLDNVRINRFCAIYQELQRLESNGDYSNISFYYPSNGSNLICNNQIIPVEVLFSDIVFFTAKKREYSKADKDYKYYNVSICFYFGDILSRHDLHFVDLAIRDSGVQNSQDFDIYFTTPLENVRSEIAAHKRKQG